MGIKKHLFLSVFSMFFALFGGVGNAWADYLPECNNPIQIVDLDQEFGGANIDDADVSGFDIMVNLSNGRQIFAVAYCSDTDDGSGSTPSEDLGEHCWCGINRYNDGTHMFSPNITTWRYFQPLGSYSDCEAQCATECFYTVIRPDYENFGNQIGLCLEFEEQCSNMNLSHIIDYDGNFCGSTVTTSDLAYPDWSMELDGGQRINGTAFCSYADDGSGNTTPGILPGQHCWCGINEYIDDNGNTYQSSPATWWYNGDLSDIDSCESGCADNCLRDYEDPGNRCDIDTATGICYSASPSTYSVTYSCNGGSGSIAASGPYSPGTTVTTPASNSCTAPAGYGFKGWSCTGGVGNVSGSGAFTMPATDVTCSAQWNPNIYTITLRNYTNNSTHGYAYEKYGTGWYSNAAATIPLSTATVPTRSNYTFRGYYTARQSDLTSSGGGGTRHITNSGGLPSNTTFSGNTRLYAAWATNCNPGTGCNCTLTVNNNGTVTYTTSAQTGYTLTIGSGTYAPVCTAIDYTVSFARGNGGAGGTMSSQTGKHYGDTITLPANGFTAPSGYVFNGWSCDNGIGNKAVDATFSMPAANVTCTAQWMNTFPFTLTTTNLTASTRTFTFNISAAGTFYVNCGSDGTLSGTGVSGNTITKNDTTQYAYTCTYDTNGIKTIEFGGTATSYTTSNNIYSAISFTPSASKVASITGDLSAIFPYLGSTDGQYPRFIQTFEGCTHLTSIPYTLFASLSGSGEYMFVSTFSGCTGLTSIPSGLFDFNGTNVSGATDMFSSTFSGCTGLTGANAIPSGLFSHVTSSAEGMFSSTFSGCTGLTTLPSGLFDFNGTAVAGAHTMFSSTFSGCTGLTSIPSGLLGSFTSGGTSMFLSMFYGCSNLETLPNNLFSFTTNITGGDYMFASTFGNCVSLTTLPDNLFGFNNHTATGNDGMFERTFDGCTGLTTLPATLFSHITTSAAGLFNHTFYGCTGLTSIPSSLFNFNNSNNVIGQSSMFNSTFYGCTGITSLPDGLFARITTTADHMFHSTFENCTGLSGYIPTDFFAGLIANGSNYTTDMMTNVFYNTGSLRTTTTGCPTNMQQYITGYESYWNSHISCENISSFNITYYDSDCSTVLTGLTPTTYTVTENVSLPTASRIGYNCNGWNGCTNANIGGWAAWSAGILSENVGLYKNCTPRIYTITLKSYNGSSTHSTIYEKYDTGWYSNSTATTTISSASVPTRDGYTFRGFVSSQTADVTANTSAFTESTRITSSGGLPSNDTFSANTNLYAAWAQNCNPGTGCNCTLSVSEDGAVTYTTSAQTGYTLTSGSGTYAPVCTGNTINLTWDGGGTPAMCTYGGTFNVPTPTARTGYVFTGWKLRNCLQSLDASISSTATYYYSITNTCCINTACTSGYCSDANFSGLSTGDWKVFFNYGTVVGTSICSETSGTSGTVGTPSATSGSYCWCAATDYTSSDSPQQCSVNNPIWVSKGTVNDCANNCAYRCAGSVKSQSGFRTALFGQS